MKYTTKFTDNKKGSFKARLFLFKKWLFDFQRAEKNWFNMQMKRDFLYDSGDQELFYWHENLRSREIPGLYWPWFIKCPRIENKEFSPLNWLSEHFHFLVRWKGKLFNVRLNINGWSFICTTLTSCNPKPHHKPSVLYLFPFWTSNHKNY